MSPDTFHQAALCAGLDAVERATDLAGDPGDGATAALVERFQLERTRRIATEQRLQLATDAALAAHCQTQVSRAAVVTLATRLHDTHAQHHPAGTTWLTCVSETCEESRSLHAATLVVHPPLRRPPTDAVVALLAGSILCRKGEVIDLELATERGRNAACWVLWLFDSFVHLLTDFLNDYEAGRLPPSQEIDDYANAVRDLLAEIGGGK